MNLIHSIGILHANNINIIHVLCIHGIDVRNFFRNGRSSGVGAIILAKLKKCSKFSFFAALLSTHNGATGDEDRVDSNAINRNTRTRIQSHVWLRVRCVHASYPALLVAK